MKKVSILGSTGSIGKNGLAIVDSFPEQFEVTALSANENYKELAQQIKKYKPKYVSIGSMEGYKELKKEFGDKLEIGYGEEGLTALGAVDESDIVLTAVSGAVGIGATIEAVKKGKRIALANKETMVVAGDIINKMVEQYGAEIIPVDSEHSALFQSLKGGNIKELKKLILTASGGPFRNRSYEELQNVSIEQALAHPNWSMGKKITIDSATLVNKGLEVIEAHYLFKTDYDKIDVVVHPESIIHSMVEFCDNSVIAQMGVPDMKLPIMYAFSYPERLESSCANTLDLISYGKLTFEKPKKEIFRGLQLAYDAGKAGAGMSAAYNGANEVAVELFLNGKIKFLKIYEIIEKCMENHIPVKEMTLENILNADRAARECARRMVK